MEDERNTVCPPVIGPFTLSPLADDTCGYWRVCSRNEIDGRAATFLCKDFTFYRCCEEFGEWRGLAV